jgi:hypothetical protein
MSVISPSAGLDEQALITEARAHARRRRRRIALVLFMVLLTAAAGVLIVRTASSSRRVAQAESRAAIAVTRTGTHTGIVTGHLPACGDMFPPVNQRAPVQPGTVVVLRGSTTRPDGTRTTQQLLLPQGPVLAHEYISSNHQLFRFELPPGQYVLGGPGYGDFRDVSVTAGKVVMVDLPACK